MSTATTELRPATLVSEHMTKSVVSVTEGASLEDVLRTLISLDVSCVLVKTEGGSPAGVVALSDLARASAVFDSVRGPLKLMPPYGCARDIMQRPILTVEADATVGQAAAKMLSHGVHRLFVRRDERIVGVFSTRDALRVVLARHIETPLRDVMARPVETISLGDSVEDAVVKLDDANLRGLVVVDGNHPVGAFTQLEAIRARALPPELRGVPVEEVMSYETITLDLSTPLYRAAGHAIATRVRRILVVDGRELVGIVTGYDLAQILV
jgi:CBS domain-containing protein